MKHEPDWGRAFGEPDARLVRTIEHTLAGFTNQKGERRVRKLRIAIIVCLFTLLVMATAWAAARHYGIFDFLNLYDRPSPALPEASELVDDRVEQAGGETRRATFRVRESVYDGQQVYLAVEIRATDPNTLLLGVDSEPEDPYDFLVRTGEDAGTIAAYAQEHGLTMLRTSISCQVKDAQGEQMFATTSMDYRLEDAGTMVYILYGTPPQAGAQELPLALTCIDAPQVQVDGTWTLDRDQEERTSLDFTLRAPQADGRVVTSAEPVVFADCGVRVDRVTLTSTPMSLYTRIEYTVIDEAAFAATEEGLFFEFLGADGERLPDGISGGYSGPAQIADGTNSATAYVQEGSVQAMQRLPDSVVLRGYNCWTKDRYETHEIDVR